MHRRQFLAIAGTVGAGALAGCSGDGGGGEPTATATPTPRPDVGLLIRSVTEAEGGGTAVTIRVVNNTDSELSSTLAVTVIAVDTERSRTTQVTVPAESHRDVTVTFPEISREAFSEDGRVEAALQ